MPTKKPYKKYFLNNMESYLVDFKNIENDINLYFNRIIETSYLEHHFDLIQEINSRHFDSLFSNDKRIYFVEIVDNDYQSV